MLTTILCLYCRDFRECHEIFDPNLFHDLNPSGPLINSQKYFLIRFRFRPDFRSKRYFRGVYHKAEINCTSLKQNQILHLSMVAVKETIRRYPFRGEHIYHITSITSKRFEVYNVDLLRNFFDLSDLLLTAEITL